MPAKYIWTPLKIETGLVMWWVGAIRIFRVFTILSDSSSLFFVTFFSLLFSHSLLQFDGWALIHFVGFSFVFLFQSMWIWRLIDLFSLWSYASCISEPFRSCCLFASLRIASFWISASQILSISISCSFSLLLLSLFCISLLLFEPFILSCLAWSSFFDRFWLVWWRLSVRLIVFQIESFLI